MDLKSLLVIFSVLLIHKIVYDECVCLKDECNKQNKPYCMRRINLSESLPYLSCNCFNLRISLMKLNEILVHNCIEVHYYILIL